MNSIDVKIPVIKSELERQIKNTENKLAHINRKVEIAVGILGSVGIFGSFMAGILTTAFGLVTIGPVALLFPVAFLITGIASGILLIITASEEDKKNALSIQMKNQINGLKLCLSHVQLPAFQKMIEEVQFNDPKDIDRLLALDQFYIERVALNQSQNELNQSQNALNYKQIELNEKIEVLALGIRQTPITVAS